MPQVSDSARETYPAHELVQQDTFVVFVVIEDSVHVSEWYGYDIKQVTVMSKVQAREHWKDRVASGFIRGSSSLVSSKYLGISRAWRG